MADSEEIMFAQFMSGWDGNPLSYCELPQEYRCRRGWDSAAGLEIRATFNEIDLGGPERTTSHVVRMWLFVGRHVRAKIAQTAGGDPTEFGPDSDATAASPVMKAAWAAYHKYAPVEMR